MPESLIVSDPRIMMGKAVVVGTRLTVEHILDELAGGRTPEDLVQAHPRLTLEGIRAALAYAAQVMRNEVDHAL